MNDIFDGIRADGAFHGCDAYACQQLLAIEGLPAPISFDHQQARSSVFIGGKSLAAFLALPATANSVSGIRVSITLCWLWPQCGQYIIRSLVDLSCVLI
jgi:hypothetical protein